MYYKGGATLPLTYMNVWPSDLGYWPVTSGGRTPTPSYFKGEHLSC